MKKLYIVPEVITHTFDAEIYTPASMGETVVGSVVGSVTGAIVADSIPGPAIPG